MRSGNVGAGHVAVVMGKYLASSMRYRLFRWASGSRSGDIGAGPKPLDLKPGDRVQVRTKEEIERTLDGTNRLRGLSFTTEMVRYCGAQFTVHGRAERIIHEQSGKMLTLRDCIILDGATCQGDFHAFCPRDVYTYWREAWLTRVD